MKTYSFKEECGVFGIWNHPEAAKLSYLGLYAQQHRGQESCGIVSLEKNNHQSGLQVKHHIHKGLGLVGDVFNDKNLSLLLGESAVGHVRYSTTGQNLMVNAQPLTSNLLNGPVAVAHNGNIVNQSILREALQREGSIFQGTNDTEILLHLMAKNPSNDLLTAFSESAEQIIGAYSFVILSNDRLLAARDPLGFRPLVLGQIVTSLGLSYVVASESCAFDLIGAEYIREIEPGEILEISASGLKSEKIKIILGQLYMPPNYGKKYTDDFAKVYSAVAKKNKVPLLGFLLEQIAGKPEFNLNDGIHPNEKGHKIVADNMYKELKPILLKIENEK